MPFCGKLYLHYHLKGMLLENNSATFYQETGRFRALNHPVFLLK